ncbi:phosphoribosylformylglycinamidine synthase, partial [bacterium]
ISIPPTLLISIIGRIEDVRRAVTMDLKAEGNHLYILGATADELGGSEYYAHLGYLGAHVPKVSFPSAKERYYRLNKAIKKGLVRSCHDCSDGGLGVALAEMAFAGGVGLEIDLDRLPVSGDLSDDKALFSESASRILVEVKPDMVGDFESEMGSTQFSRIGICTGEEKLEVTSAGRTIVSLSLHKMSEAWKSPLEDL